MSVLGNHPKRSLEMVVDFVDVFVNGAMMKKLVDPVMPGVLDDQTTNHLETQHVPEAGDDILD